MFENLTLLPVQHRADAPLTPMQRLAWALVDDLLTVQHFAHTYPHVRRWQRLVTSDAVWLAGAHAAIPFETVCELLGLDADAVRRAYFTRAKTGQDTARPAPQVAA